VETLALINLRLYFSFAMLTAIQRNRYYFILFTFFLVVANSFLLIMGKKDSFLLLNTFHNKFLDNFFLIITFIGDGLIILIVFLILFFLNKRKEALFLLVSFLLSSTIAQIFKSSFNRLRPVNYFHSYSYNKLIDGFTNSVYYSFPSGHTTTIFTLATMIVFFTKKKSLHCLVLLIAIAVGFSRIYLGQHFLEDVIFGAIIGTTISLIVGSVYLKGCIRAEQNVMVG
jgi:membrane-associated phospholipid phosphatase